ncbi:hydrogenase subunit [Candidatus Woesearchaeota archaeon]|nr:hydrogenase subunit [Candidatus Woesearchaeota archaeon]
MIDAAIKTIFVLLYVTVAFIMTRRDIISLISTYATQSFLLACLAGLLYMQERHATLLWLAALILIIKMVLIPSTIRSIQKKMKRDMEFAYVSPTGSLMLSIVIILLSYGALSHLLRELGLGQLFALGAITGVSFTMMGLVVIFSRKLVLTKIIGYLAMEDGVMIFSMFVAELPLIIEALILVDLFMLIILSTILALGMETTIEEVHKRLQVLVGEEK